MGIEKKYPLKLLECSLLKLFFDRSTYFNITDELVQKIGQDFRQLTVETIQYPSIDMFGCKMSIQLSYDKLDSKARTTLAAQICYIAMFGYKPQNLADIEKDMLIYSAAHTILPCIRSTLGNCFVQSGLGSILLPCLDAYDSGIVYNDLPNNNAGAPPYVAGPPKQ